MTPSHRQKIETKCEAFHQAVAVAQGHQANLNKAEAAFEKQLYAFPYLRSGECTGGIEKHYHAVIKHDYCEPKQRALFKDLFAQWQELKRLARDAWAKAKEIESELEEMAGDVQDEFTAAFTGRIDPLENYLRAVYEPLCNEPNEVQRLLDITPRYQRLLIDRQYAGKGKTVAGRISSLLSAIDKLNETPDLVPAGK